MLLGLHFNKYELCMLLFISSFPDTTLLLIIRLIICIVILLNVLFLYIYVWTFYSHECNVRCFILSDV